MARAPGGGGEKLPRARRITRGSEIRNLFRRGKRSRMAQLDVLDSASPLSYARVGVVVPRHGHTAVERNRLKRQLRDIARRRLLPGLDEAGLTLDVLIRAHARAYDAAYEELRRELERWLDGRRLRG